MRAWWTERHQGALGKAERGAWGGGEKECAPLQGTGVFKRYEATWEAILEEVLAFRRTNGRFPKGRSGDKNERRLYDWLQRNADTTSCAWTRERHDKLIAALGERWQSECFPKSMHAL